MRDIAIVKQQLDHAWHCYCQTAIGPCVTLLLSDSIWTMCDTSIFWQQLDHVWHCYCLTSIGLCVTLLLSDNNWTMRDIAIVRQQLDYARHCYYETAIGPCVTFLLSDSNWTMREIAIIRQHKHKFWQNDCPSCKWNSNYKTQHTILENISHVHNHSIGLSSCLLLRSLHSVLFKSSANTHEHLQ